MIRILDHNVLHPRIAKDPRLSVSQIDAIRKVADVDGDAKIEGLDQKMRPVVNTTLVENPEGATRYALLRNGDPVRPTRLYEHWV